KSAPATLVENITTARRRALNRSNAADAHAVDRSRSPRKIAGNCGSGLQIEEVSIIAGSSSSRDLLVETVDADLEKPKDVVDMYTDFREVEARRRGEATASVLEEEESESHAHEVGFFVQGRNTLREFHFPQAEEETTECAAVNDGSRDGLPFIDENQFNT
ncbi:unnamed protein product, partial [Amoebophrya sp. A25]